MPQPSAQPADCDARAAGPDDDHERPGDAPSRRVRVLPPPLRIGRTAGEPPDVDTSDQTVAARQHRLGDLDRRELSSCVASFLFHFCLLAVLGFIVTEAPPGDDGRGLQASFDELVPVDALSTDALASVEPARSEGDMPDPARELPIPQIASIDPDGSDAGDAPAASRLETLRPSDLLLATGAATGGGLEGRQPDTRARLAGLRGGTPESERAVERGLRWLAVHQRRDGSWHFDLSQGPCRGQCRNSGTEPSTTAATALAILPFLGAGYTHLEGQYQDTVERGLYYLGSRALLSEHGADLREGTMYAQGLAAIALCEAYGMTSDKSLRDLAQRSIDFIVYAQDLHGGGWRYTPGEPGDTTVTGWQLMALKSARLAGLDVPTPTIVLVERFLDSVQSEYGAQYGYLDRAPRNSTTAIGLLCRMYTGWRRNHPGLVRGAAYLDQWGPSDDDMYYDYYATQVMYHAGAPGWDKWNRRMREHLVATQATAGHEAGSWHFSGGRGDVGGRIYNTAMAVMILEVYYRYMPLYESRAVETGF